MNAVSDSDVVIDWLQGIPDALVTIDAYEKVFISLVTWIEVLTGSRTPERQAGTREALRAFEVFPVSSDIAEATIHLRQRSRLKLPDAIVLATARHLGLPLLTRNTRDFSASDPDIIVPYPV